jgi:hypothetical protein
MQAMSAPTVDIGELLDLKLLPAWLKEPAEPVSYEHVRSDDDPQRPVRDGRQTPRMARRAQQHPGKARGGHQTKTSKPGDRRAPRGRQFRREPNRDGERHQRGTHAPPARIPQVSIAFQPYAGALENVMTQIRSGSVAYSLYALARLFLEKPVGYEVRVKPKEAARLYQLGDNGPISADREFLERNAFRLAQHDFYKAEITETDPIRGNFSNVARCRLSGTLLGPTNHHNYQPQLRSLYEQRFSRRMSFADYQRQIDIVSDPALIDRWKEEARKITTYKTLKEDTPVTFSSVADAERHFRAHYLQGFIRSVDEVTIGGALSRRLPDRMLSRSIEEAWSLEARSPSNMMQELAGCFRKHGFHVFRHRRGMLFVSPIRPRAFGHANTGVSASVNSILETLSANPGNGRKQLFEKLLGDSANEEAEAPRLALASDLRWLISEGYVIEFNDGSLDLPRTKPNWQETVTTMEPAAAVPVPTTHSVQQLWMQSPLQLTWREP